MINKEVGLVVFSILVIAHIASIVYGFVKLIPNKKMPLGVKVLFGFSFLGLPFVGPAAYNFVNKHWETLKGNSNAPNEANKA